MVKNHMKRITAPRTWSVHRKTSKFITKPLPGAHTIEMSFSINTFLKEVVGIVKTTKETKYILTNDEVLVNGKRRRDFKAQVGFLDVLSIKSTGKNYLVVIDDKGILRAKEINDKQAKNRLLKISGKTVLGKDKVQLNTLNGENLIVTPSQAKTYKVGDSIIVELDSLKVLEHLPLKEKALVFVYTGKHSGKSGILESEEGTSVFIKNDKESFETSKRYLIAVNKEKIEEFGLK